MSRVEQITEQLRGFSSEEIREVRAWIDEYEDRLWDRRFEAEIAAGKWDELADRALREHREGKSTQL